MSVTELRAEIDRLNAVIEDHRRQELAQLRAALAAAQDAAAHYKAEAERNALIGRQIYNEQQEEINRLRGLLSARDRLESHARRAATS